MVVEDGTGKTDANSLCSVEDADTWHANRGITIWAPLLTEQKEAALIRATEYIRQQFRSRWAGYRKTMTQALDWPRECVPYNDGPSTEFYPNDAVPNEVRDACAELALSAAAGDLSPNVGRLVKRRKTDVLETDFESGSAPWTKFRAVENMLAPFLKSGSGNSIRLERA